MPRDAYTRVKLVWNISETFWIGADTIYPSAPAGAGADFHRYFEKALAPCKNGLNVMPRDA